ncbi:MAG: hypothetical protein EOP56_03860 [Sphingobacteriales bacterium]|nr:MAG: hypothetical protein EOP56_03860 [Sphingobacteriales bacterium]
MENIGQKAYFLRNEYVGKLQMLRPETQRRWGKMNAQQMVEHMAEYIALASGMIKTDKIVTPEENLEGYRRFLSSEKEFKENTPNVLMPEEPAPVKHATLEEAIAALKQEVEYLFKAFEDNFDKKTLNAIFGELDYEMTIQLLYKHAWHHLKQFGIME